MFWCRETSFAVVAWMELIIWKLESCSGSFRLSPHSVKISAWWIVLDYIKKKNEYNGWTRTFLDFSIVFGIEIKKLRKIMETIETALIKRSILRNFFKREFIKMSILPLKLISVSFAELFAPNLPSPYSYSLWPAPATDFIQTVHK